MAYRAMNVSQVLYHVRITMVGPTNAAFVQPHSTTTIPSRRKRAWPERDMARFVTNMVTLNV